VEKTLELMSNIKTELVSYVSDDFKKATIDTLAKLNEAATTAETSSKYLKNTKLLSPLAINEWVGHLSR
jgi:hypothetical protein